MKELLLQILSSRKGTPSSTRTVYLLSTIIVFLTLLVVDFYILIAAFNKIAINWEELGIFVLCISTILIFTGVVKYKQKKYED